MCIVNNIQSCWIKTEEEARYKINFVFVFKTCLKHFIFSIFSKAFYTVKNKCSSVFIFNTNMPFGVIFNNCTEKRQRAWWLCRIKNSRFYTFSFLLCLYSVSGIFFILPCIDAYARVDLRTRTYDIPPQEVRFHTYKIFFIFIYILLLYNVFFVFFFLLNVRNLRVCVRTFFNVRARLIDFCYVNNPI